MDPVNHTPIRSLQTMLALLSHLDRTLPRVQPDGRFGEKTMEAVMVFQRKAGLPVTGEADRATWDAILEAHRDARRQLSPPRPVSLLPHHGRDIAPGQSTPLLYPIQGMLLALSHIFEPVIPTDLSGVLDEATAHNLRWLQNRVGREETGILDRDTWEDLTRLYETFITRHPDHQP